MSSAAGLAWGAGIVIAAILLGYVLAVVWGRLPERVDPYTGDPLPWE